LCGENFDSAPTVKRRGIRRKVTNGLKGKEDATSPEVQKCFAESTWDRASRSRIVVGLKTRGSKKKPASSKKKKFYIH